MCVCSNVKGRYPKTGPLGTEDIVLFRQNTSKSKRILSNQLPQIKSRFFASAGSMLHAKCSFDPLRMTACCHVPHQARHRVSGDWKLPDVIPHASYTHRSAYSPNITNKTTNPTKWHIRTESFLQLRQKLRKKKTGRTHSRYLVQGAGSDMAMKKQLVRMVNIMNRLNNLETGVKETAPGHTPQTPVFVLSNNAAHRDVVFPLIP